MRVPCCSEMSARLEICRPCILRGTGPSGSQRSQGDDRVARGVGSGSLVCEDSQHRAIVEKGERMEAAVVWQPVVVVVRRSVVFFTDSARQGVVAHRVW